MCFITISTYHCRSQQLDNELIFHFIQQILFSEYVSLLAQLRDHFLTYGLDCHFFPCRSFFRQHYLAVRALSNNSSKLIFADIDFWFHFLY